MNALKKSSLIVGVVVLVLAVVMGCKNPFQVGLGDKVDLDVPDVALLSHPAGEYLSGTVTLSGVYTDDFEISGITLSFDGGVTLFDATTDAAALTWEYEVNTADHPDGETEILLTITDLSGKEIQKRILYYFDNAAPIVMVTIPQNYVTNAYNGNITVKGEAADQFGLSALEYRLLNAGGTEVKTWTEADGTSSWSALFDSREYIAAGSGTVKVELRATDRAGNSSLSLVHYDNVLDRNGSQAITAEALIKILRGETVTGAVISAADLVDIQLDSLELQINQDLDAPTFVISNPDENEVLEDNVLSGNPRFTGTVEDDSEGVDPTSIQFMITDYDTGTPFAPYDDWTNVTSTTGTGLLVRWAADVVGLVDGTYNMQARANDLGTGSGTSNPVPFQVDTGAPSIMDVLPDQGTYVSTYVTPTFDITGTAVDGTGVTRVRLSINEGAWLEHVTAPNPDFDWSIEVDPDALGLSDGNLSVKIEATDGASVATFNLQLILDSTPPSANFINPPASSTVNGQVIIRGTASDNSQVTLVELQVGSQPPFLPLPGTYNWEYMVDTTAYANDTDAVEVPPLSGSGVWDLEVFARITDIAGNVDTVSYNFFIDNDLDKPRATVLSPADGQAISGSVFVTGTAIDDDGVLAVYMQLDVNNNGNYEDVVDLDGTPFDENLEITVDGTTAWSYELNGDGRLYFAPDDGWVTMMVWVEDINGLDGNPVEQSIQFDDSKARVDNLSLSSGDYVAGVFPLTGDVVDDVEVTTVELSTDGGQNWDSLTLGGTVGDIGSGDPWQATLTQDGGVHSYDLVLDVDTTGPTGLDIGSGILYLRIRVDDGTLNHVNQTISLINLYVDNLYPEGEWAFPDPEDPLDLRPDPRDINGAAALVQGTATDTGVISGIEEIHVYFVEPGSPDQVYDLDWDVLPEAAALTDVVTTDFGDGGGSVSYTPDNGVNLDPPPETIAPYYRIEIDKAIEAGDDGGDNGDGDTFNEGITYAGGTYTWYAEFDSRVLPDGPVDLHFVVFDSAGNGHHYLVDAVPDTADPDTTGYQSSMITNFKPSITQLTLGSNLDFSENSGHGDYPNEPRVSDPGETVDFTDFTSDPSLEVRERLYVKVAVSDDDAAGLLTYEVKRQSDDSVLTVLNGDYLNGAEINVTDVAWEDLSHDLYVLVTDTDSITVRQDFNVYVDSADGVAPHVYLLDDITHAKVVNGHVEADDESRDFSSYAYGTFSADATADVSGIINIEGNVADDQRIQSIELKIYDADEAGHGYDPPGTPDVDEWFTIASWDTASGRLEYNNTDFPTQYAANTPTESQTLNASGHVTNFSFEWDSSEIIDVAEENVVIRMRVTDFGPLSSSTNVTVDIVPYIFDLDAYSTQRTRNGKFTLPEDVTGVEVSGYNLDITGTSWVRIYDSAGADFTDLTSTDPAQTNYRSFEFDLSTEHSGYLWVDVAGVAAINNFNDNGLSQNDESGRTSSTDVDWNDDRYIDLWDVGYDFEESDDAEYAAMAVNSDGLHYAAWSYYNDSHRRYGTDTGIVWTYIGAPQWDGWSYSYGGGSYDPSEWNDIAFNHTNDDFFIVNLWNQNVTGTMQSLRLHAFEGAGFDDDTDVIEIDQLGDTLYRFRNPRIAVKDGVGAESGSTIIYVSYYDARDTERDLMFSSYTYDGNLAQRAAGENITVASTGDVGLYSDIGIDDDGYPFIVYFDNTTKQLKIARAANDDPTAAGGQWAYGVVDTDTNIGEFVSVAVEGDDGTVHIAAYDSGGGDLQYYEASHVDSPGSFSFTQTPVDTEDNVGRWAEITVSGGEPYISYINQSESGTPRGLKYAYRQGAVWEHGTVPV